MSSRIGNWGARHGHALVSTLGYLARHGLATTLTVIALSLALALPLGLQLLVRNVRDISGALPDAVGISVYLKPQLAETRVQQLAQSVRMQRGVRNVTLISAAQGLAQLRAQSGFGAALAALPDNPLPAVLEVHPTAAASTPARLEGLRAALAALPGVDAVQLDRAWAERFNAIVALVRRALLSCAALLALGAIAVVGNTIRLEIQGRAAEIEVMRLVGGSNAFVRRPFLYAGLLYGLIAALLAFVLVGAARFALAGAAARLASAYGSRFVMLGPGPRELGALLGAGALLGWLGAAIVASRQLARITPRAD